METEQTDASSADRTVQRGRFSFRRYRHNRNNPASPSSSPQAPPAKPLRVPEIRVQPPDSTTGDEHEMTQATTTSPAAVKETKKVPNGDVKHEEATSTTPASESPDTPGTPKPPPGTPEPSSDKPYKKSSKFEIVEAPVELQKNVPTTTNTPPSTPVPTPPTSAAEASAVVGDATTSDNAPKDDRRSSAQGERRTSWLPELVQPGDEDSPHISLEKIRQGRRRAMRQIRERERKAQRFVKQEEAPKKKRRFRQSFYWLASNHKKIGFRHIVMLLLVTIYSFIGAGIFYNLEAQNEVTTVHKNFEALNDAVSDVALELVLRTKNGTAPKLLEMQSIMKNTYIAMLNLEGIYDGSTYYKMQDPQRNFQWTFGSAFFFSNNLYSTIGYGNIYCKTVAGQIATMFFSLITIPLTLVVLRDLGQWTLVHITKAYGRAVFRIRALRGLPTNEDELIELPLKFCLSLLFSYLVFTTIVVYNYDALWGPAGTGIAFFDSFYFSFISLATIGLGDVMPNNAPYSPFLAMIIFFGLPVMKVINRVTYITIENGVFGTLTVLENNLELMWFKKHADIETGESASAAGSEAEEEEEEEEEGGAPEEQLNYFTVRSIATFMRARNDVYAGDFGRVTIKKSDLE